MNEQNRASSPPKEASDRVEAIREAGRALRRGNIEQARLQLDRADRLGRFVAARLRSRLDYEDIP